MPQFMVYGSDFPLPIVQYLRFRYIHNDYRKNRISDITPISQLPDLYSLVLNDNQITDIAPLKDLPQLQNLELMNNQIREVSVVESLKNLSRLQVKGNPIRDLTPIHRLRRHNANLDVDIDGTSP